MSIVSAHPVGRGSHHHSHLLDRSAGVPHARAAHVWSPSPTDLFDYGAARHRLEGASQARRVDRAPAPGRLLHIDGVTDGSSAPRTLWIWVPNEPPTHHLYVHDGQNLFDPSAPHGGWSLHESVGPRTLVVGIETVKGRFDDLTPWPDVIDGEQLGGRGEAYANLVLNTIVPLIEKRFGAPQRRGIMGSSLGGLMALYQAARNPGAWDFAGSVSGTVGWGNFADPEGPDLADSFGTPSAEAPCLYLDSGGFPGGPDNYDDNNILASALAARGYRWEENLFRWYEPGAEHNEREWRKRVWRPLLLFESL